jgi:hypothetical protein
MIESLGPKLQLINPYSFSEFVLEYCLLKTVLYLAKTNQSVFRILQASYSYKL